MAGRAGIATLIALGALVTLPAGASAATVFGSGATVQYTAAVGETNDVTARQLSPGQVRVVEASASLTTTGGCTADGPNAFVCSGFAFDADLLDQDDSVDATGLSSPVLVRGHGGVDTLTGGDATDELEGGAGADVLNGGGGSDFASYLDAPSGVDVNLSVPGVSGGDGADQLSSIESVRGSDFTDVLRGDDGANSLFGQGGVDSLFGTGDGTPQDDVPDDLRGGEDGDFLVGHGGADRLDGEGGSDVASYIDSTGPVTASLAASFVSNDGLGSVDGLFGMESLTGSLHDDLLAGDAGDNDLNGNNGTDTLTFAASSAAITADLGFASSQATGDGSDRILNFENVIGSPQGDTLTGSAGANAISGGNGDDDLRGAAGDDALTGGAGDDDYDGGADRDRAVFSGASGAVSVDLGTGTATGDGGVEGLAAIEDATGSGFGDSFTAGSAANAISAGAGDDTIQATETDAGDGGADAFDGEGGTDRLSYDGSSAARDFDVPSGEVEAPGATDSIAGFERYTGTAQDDGFTGGGGPDLFEGGAGDDTAAGGGGADDLNGDGAGIVAGFGSDTLAGGPGADTLRGGDDLPANTDTVDYSGASGPVAAELSEAAQEADDDGEGSSDQLFDVDRFVGSDFADEIANADPTGEAVVVESGDGDDTLRVRNTLADAIDCGPGTDHAVIDPLVDEASVTACEAEDDPAPPATPSIDGSDPASGADDNSPRIRGTALSGSSVSLYVTPDCSGAPLASGPAAEFASPGLAVSVPDDSTTTLRAALTTPFDVDGPSACSAPFEYREVTPDPDPGPNPDPDPSPDPSPDPGPGPQPDNAAPETFLVDPPTSTTKRRATFAFRSSEEGSHFRCRVDKRKPRWCASPKRTGNLKPGMHVFRVRAVDAAGNADPTAAKIRFRVRAPQ